ncbi:MAG: endonuclease domain-containing protein [Ignavibacteria bacterium]|nr:endonuclease domain-containing protein [Ignavibacteria bacterium]
MNRYPHEIIEKARELRQHQTLAEELLWAHLRRHQFRGLKFKRQHRIGNFIVDFYCAKMRLVIEVKGGVHDIPAQRERDSARFEELHARNYHVLRIKNNEVLNDIGTVMKKIVDHKW